MNGAYAYKAFPQRPFPQNNGGDNLADLSGDAMNSFMTESQSLDDMILQNEKSNRRQSMPVYGGSQMHMGSPDSRRLSMLQFGDGTSMEDFQFDGTMDGLMRNGTFPRTTADMQTDRMNTAGPELAINTQFSQDSPGFSNIPAYGSPMHPNANLDMEMTSPYPNMSLAMDDTLMMTPNEMNMFPNTQFPTSMMNSPIAQDFTALTTAPPPEPATSMPPPDQYRSNSSSATPDTRSKAPTRTSSQDQVSMRSSSRPQSEHPSSSASNAMQMVNASLSNQEPVGLPTSQELSTDVFNQIKFPWSVPPGGFPSTMNSNPHMKTQFKNAYSSTGFDMLGVLMRVATRPNPQIDIGSVDLSCAFVVCDAEKDDQPIVYCSENFERLTGYSKHMILGRNCRFLQSPDGRVEPGVKRRYVDDESVYYLKQMTITKQEAQISLINYRRGGQPFMNLLTMIPIAWDSGTNIKFIVGFQVDLVEQPGSMTNKNPDGSYRVNYQRGMSMPSYVFSDHKPQPDQGQTISKDEVSNVLTTYGSTGDSEITRRIWDKILLENTDDVVHVLSLKGLFLYLSPSSNRILEYDPSELVGTALSSVCHPSDIVPVTRELKETNSGASVNVVFRIRRKKSGYMWFEGHGSLHTEQGKGRKCIILVGRERPVYTLSKTIVRASGGIGDNELWSKMSTSGMFLFVSSNVRSLLDRQPEDLVGSSIQQLMRQESKVQFSRILELARTGRKGEVKHEMINKRGQVLQAFTTVYPGDAIEGQKPTFLVAQTRLLKYTRNNAGQRPPMNSNQQRNSGDSHASLHSGQSSASPLPASQSNTGSATPQTTGTESRFLTTEGSATTFAGQHGLQIGHQDHSLASEDNVFDELKTTRNTSWQFELRQMEKRNRYLAEEVQTLLAAKKKRKRRKGAGQLQKDCANCHTRTTPEWRRGPSGNRDLCNSCGLRWAKQQGRVSPRTSSVSDKSKKSVSPRHTQNILPNVISETGRKSSVSSNPAQPDKNAGQHDPHAPKVARTEPATASHAYSGATSNVPPKIEEASEPD